MMIRNALPMAFAAALLAAGPVLATSQADMRPAFGNTIVSTHPDGRQAKLWLNADQTYAAQGRKGQRSSGQWKIKGEKICLTQKAPTAIPISACKVLPKVAVGAAWSDKAFNGDRVTNRLVAGRAG